MSMSIFRRTKLAELMQAENSQCHYCRKQVRLRVAGNDCPDDATIDHKVALSKGGTNADDNLLLACRECNHAKGDRSYEDFLERPYRLNAVRKTVPRKRTYIPKREVIEATKKADKVLRWSMAAAIARGELTESGAYRKAPMDLKPEPKKPAAPKMSALEAARWLREMHERKGKPWPLA